MKRVRVLFEVCVAVLVVAVAPVRGGLIGPSQYRSASDSPFTGLSFSYFYLEDFEDGALDTPGVSANGGIISSTYFAASMIDSVDADDGLIDGSGNGGDSWWSRSPLVFTFDADTLGSLPTHVGVVWTDGGNPVTFEAFDQFGLSLGVIGPVNIADDNVYGGTAEDHFFGITHSSGVWQIEITAAIAIEVDHLQYGFSPVPAPGAALLGTLGAGLVAWLRRRHAV